MHKRILLILLMMLPLMAMSKDGDEFFARIEAQNEGKIYVGDSALVSVCLYSNRPFGEIKANGPKVKISGCRVRQVYQGGNRRQSVTNLNGKAYYTTVWAQYIVGSDKKGTYSFPLLNFNATLYIEQEQSIDPYDPFGFFRQPVYKKVNKATSTTKFSINVVAAPLKTTEDLLKSGKTVI